MWRVLLALGAACAAARASQDVVRTFSDPVATTGSLFNHLVVDRNTGRVYIGAVNNIYQLSPDLEVVQSIETGPVNDSAQCTFDCPPNFVKKPTDNVNKALVIDYATSRLITCGSVLLGLCSVRNLNNISHDVREVREPVVANNASASTVAFIAPGPPNPPMTQVMYVGVTFTGNSPYRSEVPTVSSRSLEDDRLFMIARTAVTSSMRMFVNSLSRERYPINYVYGFSSEGFSYFLTTQLRGVGSDTYYSKLVRVCHDDENYYSYTEIPMSCMGEGGGNFGYNLVQAAFVGKAGSVLAGELGITAQHDVLFAAFSQSESINTNTPSNLSALCVYSLKAIRRKFMQNIKTCFSGNGSRGLDFISPSNACIRTKLQSISEDFCGLDVNTPLGGEQPVEAVPVAVFKKRLTAVAATATGDYTVVFAGTSEGHLKKIVVESATSAFQYGDIFVDEKAPVNKDLFFDTQLMHLYVMTEHKVSKVKVQECSVYKSCQTCLGAKDPYCGWCSLENKCSLRSDCQEAVKDSLFWISYRSGRCSTITQFTALDRTLITHATRKPYGVNCTTPRTDTLPPIPAGQHHFTAKLSVRTTQGPDFVATNFTFFDCNTYSSCTQCVSSSFPCDWCVDGHRCTHDTTENCRNDILVTGVSRIGPSYRSGPGFCPTINSTSDGTNEILVPSGVRKAIKVKVRIIGQFIVQKRFVCQFNIEGRVTQVNAQLLADTIYCEPVEFTYTSRAPNITASFAVIWGGSKPLDNPNDTHILIYRCNNMADTCGICLALPEKFGCGWCQGSDRCEVQEQCGVPSVWPKDHLHWISYRSGSCSTITQVTPNQLQPTTARTLDLVIENLPTLNGQFLCAFTALDRTLITNATRKPYGVNCTTPRTDTLPPIPAGQHHFTAKLSVRTTQGPDFVATNFTFFDCNTYSSCTQCVSSSFPCDWCVDGHRCTHDTTENFRNDILVTGVSRIGPSYRSGPGFCPTINSTSDGTNEILVPSGVRKAIKVKVRIIGQFIVQKRFVCQFNIEGRVTQVNAQLLADTIYCEPVEFTYASRAPNITASFAVIWGGSKPLDNPNDTHILIYRCNNMADTCGICLALPEKFGCGWCQGSDRCEVQEQCGVPSVLPKDHLHWISYRSGSCSTITQVTPNQLQPTTARTLDLVIENLPTLNGQFLCAFTALDRTLITNATRKPYGVNCTTPRTDTLPPIPAGQHHFTAKLSVRTTQGPDFVATNFTFFDCNTYSSCTQCVSSSFPCDWCVDGHRCTHDTTENCRNDILVTGVSRIGPSYRSGPGFCPTINSTSDGTNEILVPSGVRKAIKVKVRIIGQFIVQKRFVCQFNIEGRVTQVNAQLLADTIYCEPVEFTYASRAPNITASFAVIWGGSKPLDNPNDTHILIYRCNNMADTCGICLALPEKFGCGWCQGSDRCEVQEQCGVPSVLPKDHLHWISYRSGSCSTITQVTPNQLQPTTARTLDLVIENLPTLNGQFLCAFTALDRTLITNATRKPYGVNCTTPRTDTLPPIPAGQHHFTAKLSVRTTQGPDFVATNFTFFDCNTYSSCTQCVSSSFPCDWCVDGHRCTHDTTENCRNDILVTGVSRIGPSYRSGPGFCPTINSTSDGTNEILVPSGVRKAIKVKVRIIGQFIVQKRFVCQFNIEGRVTQVNAQLLADTIYCEPVEFTYTSRAPNITASFAVIWGGSKPLDNPNDTHILIYRCNNMADNCGICLALPEKFGCGWCQGSDRCEVQEQCGDPSVWQNRTQTCPNPEIHYFN
nr:uncharacterized protein LOC117989797 [Maniola hyperantus]